MHPVTIRGVTLGSGPVRVIVPLCESAAETLLCAAADLADTPADLVEWRMDALDGAQDTAALLAAVAGVRRALGEKPLLATCRTLAEGGSGTPDAAGYITLCKAMCDTGCIDAIDIELCAGDETVRQLCDHARSHQVVSVVSSHDFAKTPPVQEMADRLHKMQLLGADIAKLAVMPRNRQDVAALLAATAQVADQYPQTPLITMSMGPLGAVTRLCGGRFGSAATFAAAGRSSAPGQPGLAEARTALKALDSALL